MSDADDYAQMTFAELRDRILVERRPIEVSVLAWHLRACEPAPRSAEDAAFLSRLSSIHAALVRYAGVRAVAEDARDVASVRALLPAALDVLGELEGLAVAAVVEETLRTLWERLYVCARRERRAG